MRIALGLIVALLLSGCQSDPNVLDRAEALKLVQAEVNLSPPDKGCLALRPNGWEQGREQGYWTESFITAKGQPFFASVKRDRLCLPKPPSFTVEIKGIADAGLPSYKEIEFHISNNSLPDPIRRFIVAGYQGRAVARRFDDGWRLEGRVPYQRDDGLLDISEAQGRAVQKDLEEEAARQQVADAYQANQEAAFNAMVEESRTPQQANQTFHCEAVIGTQRMIIDLFINDVQVVRVGKTIQIVGSVTGTSTYRYGHIPSYKIEEDWLKFEQQNAGSGTHFRYFYPRQCDNFDAALASFRGYYDGWWKRFDAVGSAQ